MLQLSKTCISKQNTKKQKSTIICQSKKSLPKGVYSIKNLTIRNNLMGTSRYMKKKGWIDFQGRKSKGYGVYRFSEKYGSNVDGYSPIYSPDEWAQTGNNFSFGTLGLFAWA